MKKYIWLQLAVMFLCALVLCGCVCDHTHVRGRQISHGTDPDSVDAFFCVLDYMIFTPDGDLRSDDTRDEDIRREQRERSVQEQRERRRRR